MNPGTPTPGGTVAVSAMTDPAAAAAIASAAKALQLPTVRDEATAIAAAATKARLTHQSFLAHVLLAECDDRDSRRRIRRVNEAKFPRAKRLDGFEVTAVPDLTPATLGHLAGGAWIDAGEPLVLLGDSGTGKTHLLIALGTAAAEQGRRVRYVTTAALVNELVEAADDKQLSRVVGRYARLDLLCLDEIGYVNLDPRGAELLFQIITAREERASIACASNDPVQRMGHHLHRPPPGRRRRGPAHLPRPHHQHRHRLLTPYSDPQRQERSRHHLTTGRARRPRVDRPARPTPRGWGQIRAAQWGQIDLSFSDHRALRQGTGCADVQAWVRPPPVVRLR